MGKMSVKQAQWQLWLFGYYTIPIDGIWGRGTEQGIAQFKRDFNIAGDSDEVDDAFADKSIEIVKNVQSFLNNKVGTRYNVDGLAGNNTKSAVMTYQGHNGLVSTGVINSVTLSHMKSNGLNINAKPNPSVPCPPNAQLSKPSTGDWWDGIKYFTKSEFKCKCGGRYCNGYPAELRRDMVEIADGMREHFGRPARVSSGLRCRQHNANEGGVYNSQHMYGEACDISIPGCSAQQLLKYLDSVPGVTYKYAINNNYIHFNVSKGAR